MLVYFGVNGWWCVSFDGLEIAKFRAKADAQIFAVCCFESGHAERVTLASGEVI